MTKLTTLDLSPLFRNSIGFDALFDRITRQIDTAAATNYPPYNIVEISETVSEIEVAVAGFTQGDIEVSINDGQLIITGEKKTQTERVFTHQGISAKRFIRTFLLGEYTEVKGAVVKDGILTVQIERVVPEAMKPKTIAITYKN